MKIYLDDIREKFITKTELNKITRRALEKNIIGKTVGGDIISEINGVECLWNYRRDEGYFNPVCKKNEADHIIAETRCGFYLKRINF